ncbi:aspartate kinase [Oceanobacillus sp. CAU 1775]
MKLLVQKYGGSSLATPEKRKYVRRHILDALEKDYKLIVVVSAMGKTPSPYATDSLLDLVNYPDTDVSDRELDLLLSCGEIISAIVLSNEMKQDNISVTALTGGQAGILTNTNHTNANIKYIDTTRIKKLLETYDVVVVAGFQGATLDGEITTIGRGGSDTTAAALGAATNADRADIFTDVEGIMTADPKIVEEAKVLRNCTYDETCNLAYQGAKVIHPQAVEIAMQAKLPLQIRATNQKKSGTLILTNTSTNKIPSYENRPITGIAHLTGIAQVKIKRKDNLNFSLTKVFKEIAKEGISIDFINLSPNEIIFTLPKTLLNRAKFLFDKLNVYAEITENCAKVSAVGMGMSGIPGVAAKVVTALAKKDIQILQAADSHTTIWVLVYEKDLKLAVNALHDEFQLSGTKAVKT